MVGHGHLVLRQRPLATLAVISGSNPNQFSRKVIPCKTSRRKALKQVQTSERFTSVTMLESRVKPVLPT